MTGIPHRRVFFASAVGSMIEFYDFFVYGMAAALVFPTVFFPGMGANAARLASFAMFGAAYLARPLGGLVFGHLGDTLGRKRALVATLLLMGFATAGVGLTPSAAAAGWAAPVLVLALRVAQGFAAGGEVGGAAVLAVESAPPGKSGRMGAALTFGAATGQLLSSTAFLAANKLAPGPAFLAWGWRAPFIGSLALVAVGLYVRLRVGESPVFANALAAGETVRSPGRAVFRESWGQLALASVGVLAGTMLWALKDSFFASYANAQLGIGRDWIFTVGAVGSGAMAVAALAGGRLGDMFSRSRLGVALYALLAVSVALLPILSGAGAAGYAVAMLFMNIALGLLCGSMVALVVLAFPPKTRHTAFGLAYAVAGAVGGGILPMFVVRLSDAHGAGAVTVLLLVVVLLSVAGTSAIGRARSEARLPARLVENETA